MRKILVTGGCGFIGSNLVAALAADGGFDITVLDDLSIGAADTLKSLKNVVLHQGDIRDAELVDRLTAGKDLVAHLAAQTSVIHSIDDPEQDFSVNAMGTLTLLQAARRHGIKRFVLASSVAPMGNRPPPIHEDLAPNPMSPYGAGKLAAEGYCSAFWHSYALPTVTLRFSNAYGPGSGGRGSVIAAFFQRIIENKTLTLYGDGRQTRDFIYVADMCRSLILALTHPLPESCFGQVYQVATGVETSLTQLLDLMLPMAQADGRSPKIERLPCRAGEIERNWGDPTRFFNTFGYRPDTGLQQGLPDTWAYFQSMGRME